MELQEELDDDESSEGTVALDDENDEGKTPLAVQTEVRKSTAKIG